MPQQEGKLYQGNEACVEVEFKPSGKVFEFMIDTGFNGGLCLPRYVFNELELEVEDEVPFSGIGGHQAMADIAYTEIIWLEESLEVSVLVNDGEDFLLGTQLLIEKELYINYKTREVLVTAN